jgi:hypothetical protein
VDVIGFAIFGALVGLFGLWVAALIDVGRTDHGPFVRAGTSKGLMIALLLLSGGLGAVYWFAIMRRRVHPSA